MALKSLRTFNFGKTEELNLGIKTRVGSSKSVEIPQVDIEGNPLVGVSMQAFELLSKGTSLSHRFAYHKAFNSYAQVIENELTGDLDTNRLPAPMKKVADFETAIASLPESVRATEKGGKMVDIEYVKLDPTTQEVLEEVAEISGTFYRLVHNQPVYKQYYTTAGIPITADKTGAIEDENGDFFKNTPNKYSYICNVGIGIFNGVAINERGDAISGTEGTYMAVGPRDQADFMVGAPTRSGVKVAVKSIMSSVLGHPVYGVLEPSIAETGNIPKGKFKVNKGTAIGIFNAAGEIALKLDGKDGRLGYKLSNFIPVKKRNSEATEVAKVEVEKAIETKGKALDDMDF